MISCVAAALEQAPGGPGQGQGRYGSAAVMHRFKQRQMPSTARTRMTSCVLVCLCVFTVSTRSYSQVLDKATLMCCGDSNSPVRARCVHLEHECASRCYSFFFLPLSEAQYPLLSASVEACVSPRTSIVVGI